MNKLLLIALLFTASVGFSANWVGKSSGEVVEKLGVPDREFKTADAVLWVYISHCSDNGFVNPAAGMVNSDSDCLHRTFTIKNDKVVNYRKKFK